MKVKRIAKDGKRLEIARFAAKPSSITIRQVRELRETE